MAKRINETITKIADKVQLLNNLHNGRKGNNAKLRIVSVPVNENNSVYFFIYGLDVIGKCLSDEFLYERFCLGAGIDPDIVDEDSSIAGIARQSEESKDLDYWVFDEEGYLEEYVERAKISQVSKKYLEENSYTGRSHEMITSTDEGHDMETSRQLSRNHDVMETLPVEEDLLKQKVVISDKLPVTNTISLAKDFDLIERDFIKLVNETITFYPYLIVGTTIEFYKEGQRFNKYVRVQEELYQRILKVIPSSTDPKIMFLRDTKEQEYFQAFRVMRTWFYEHGFSKEDLETLLQERRVYTNIMRDNIKSMLDTSHYDGVDEDVYRHIFNMVNANCGIKPISYNSQMNRNVKDVQKQQQLLWVEKNVSHALKVLAVQTQDVMKILSVLEIYVSRLDYKNKRIPDLLTIMTNIIK